MTRRDLLADAVFVIDEFFTPKECAREISRTEARGYDEAPVTTASGPVMDKSTRNNARVMIDDVPLAIDLWSRLRDFLPPPTVRWEPIGLNERIRYYRYDPGERFAPHLDGYFRRENGEVSRLTFMVYLNEGFTGGETIFCIPGELVIKPVTGLALVFQHQILHEGAAVIHGRKYVLRSDVMYRHRRKSEPADSSATSD